MQAVCLEETVQGCGRLIEIFDDEHPHPHPHPHPHHNDVVDVDDGTIEIGGDHQHKHHDTDQQADPSDANPGGGSTSTDFGEASDSEQPVDEEPIAGGGGSEGTPTEPDSGGDASQADVPAPPAPEPPVEDDAVAKSPLLIAREAEMAALELFGDNRVLEAEDKICQALATLNSRPQADNTRSAEIRAAEKYLRASSVFKAVNARAQQYYSIRETLKSVDFKLAWKHEGSCLWVKASPGATWFEYRLLCDIDAPLAHCLAYSNELDLMPKYEPLLVGAPEFLGQVHPLLVVTRTLMSVLMLRIEMVFEVLRFTNEDYGFIAESVRSRFPTDDRPVPPRHWRNRRILLDTQNVWLPRGGGDRGTTISQVSRAEVGFPISEKLISYVISMVASSLVRNLRKNAKLVGEANGPHLERLSKDGMGLYAECIKAEVAAARRERISAERMPGPEIFDRRSGRATGQ